MPEHGSQRRSSKSGEQPMVFLSRRKQLRLFPSSTFCRWIGLRSCLRSRPPTPRLAQDPCSAIRDALLDSGSPRSRGISEQPSCVALERNGSLSPENWSWVGSLFHHPQFPPTQSPTAACTGRRSTGQYGPAPFIITAEAVSFGKPNSGCSSQDIRRFHFDALDGY